MKFAPAGLAFLVVLGACETCPLRATLRHTSDKTVECCDAVIALEFFTSFDDAEVDLAVTRTGAPTEVEAWLTRDTCARLFDSGSNTPLCEILIGPVRAGDVSERRKATGRFRIWVRQMTPVQMAVPYGVDAVVWRHTCAGGPISPG
jgi:hypothetical protein